MKQEFEAKPSIPVKEDQDLHLILKLKRNGTDCSEDQSAEIKSYLRDNWLTENKKIEDLFYQLYYNFPQEFNEVWEEFDADPIDMPPTQPQPVKDELFAITKRQWYFHQDMIWPDGAIVTDPENDEDDTITICNFADKLEDKDNANIICTAVNNTYGKGFDPKMVQKLYEALEGLCKEINLGKLNIRKDFSLINAHAYANKVLHNAKTIKP